MPVLPAKGQGHPREAVGTVFGDVSVHSLGSSWVSHGHELVKQRLRDYILHFSFLLLECGRFLPLLRLQMHTGSILRLRLICAL